jgi:hypothetical protein
MQFNEHYVYVEDVDNSSSSTSSGNDSLSDDVTSFDELNYLSQMLGPQRQPLGKLVPLTVVYTVMSITGIFGNLSVCCVILRIPSMRSATNYYLFSLAISDLLILLLGKYSHPPPCHSRSLPPMLQ